MMTVETKRTRFSNHNFVVVAGPCSIESEDQFLSTVKFIKQFPISMVRGGVWKLRTSPHAFQGLGAKALDIVSMAKETFGVEFIAEITDPRQVPLLSPIVDMFQVGSRNMYNYDMLKELGKVDKPVLLKRGFSATYDEWINAREYLKCNGNAHVVFCERGIRGFDSVTRNVVDLGTVAYMKSLNEGPIIVDPSHGTGLSELVEPMALAALAAGADGLMVEVHPNPQDAKSDSRQALSFDQFEKLMVKLIDLLPHFNKKIGIKNTIDTSIHISRETQLEV